MNITKEGFDFSFNPDGCKDCKGRCCKGEAGFIWVDKNEIENIVKFLNVSFDEFEKGCLKKVNGNYSIKDIAYQGERVCFFFDTEKNNCSIYEVRPSQCRTFPFWDRFKENRKDLEQECPAIVF